MTACLLVIFHQMQREMTIIFLSCISFLAPFCCSSAGGGTAGGTCVTQGQNGQKQSLGTPEHHQYWDLEAVGEESSDKDAEVHHLWLLVGSVASPGR